MNAGQAYVQAALALERVKPCRVQPVTYGFPKCNTHQGGEFLDLDEGQRRCNRSGTEGMLRLALADLVGSLELDVRADS